ncbi:MAG TPA: nuclear transport factor 2 family protein [Bauldia sp.]|nr:nuclear transport factor 2 family protein [Bauldia sp.]
MPEIETLLRRNLTDIFAERDDARRRAAIAELTTDDVIFVDPNGGRHDGREPLNASVAALYARMPTFVFSELPPLQVIEGAGRVHWGFGPPGARPVLTGLDVILVRDGRIAALYTFIDPRK